MAIGPRQTALPHAHVRARVMGFGHGGSLADATDTHHPQSPPRGGPHALEGGLPSPARCGAQTRQATPCKAKPIPGRTRCKNHGGMSTGPLTVIGKAKVALNLLRSKGGRIPHPPDP